MHASFEIAVLLFGNIKSQEVIVIVVYDRVVSTNDNVIKCKRNAF